MAKQRKNELSTANWIVKSNALNEIRNSHMTISQMRLFSIYLSKINPMEVSSREVTFKLEEYTKIMQFKQTNTTRLRQSADDLLKLVIVYTRQTEDFDKKTGLRGFESASSLLFNHFKLHKNDDNEWLVSINCHDDVLKLMFELKKHYFKYRLWNSLQLASTNQQRMYEILKQYEVAGAREVSVKDLREFLGLKASEYTAWDNFRRRILETSQEALTKYTDIKFTWEVAGKRGKGGKINNLRFNIEKNDDYIQPITFDDFPLEQEQEPTAEEFEMDSKANDILKFLSSACNNEFDLSEIAVLHNSIIQILPYNPSDGLEGNQIAHYNFLKAKYDELKWRATRTTIKSRFGYLKKIIEVELTQPTEDQ